MENWGRIRSNLDTVSNSLIISAKIYDEYFKKQFKYAKGAKVRNFGKSQY